LLRKGITNQEKKRKTLKNKKNPYFWVHGFLDVFTGSLGFGLPITPHPTACCSGRQMESDDGPLAWPWDLR